MANDSIIYEATELRNGYFAGVGTVVMRADVLGGELHTATVDLERQWLESHCRRRDDDLSAAARLDLVKKTMKEEGGLTYGEVHLPVAHDISFHIINYSTPRIPRKT